jgi:predicted transcriptional regulator
MTVESLKEALEKHTIVIRDPILRKGFTIVPNVLFAFMGLSHGARLTYVLLLKHAWQEGSCFPGIDRLAEQLEVERKSVMRYTKELQDAGLITIERRGLRRTNIYHINRLKMADVLKLKSHG